MAVYVTKTLRLCVISLIITMVYGCATIGHDFDENNVAKIKKGETTEADLIKMFGDPTNRSINSDGIKVLTWTYTQARVKSSTFIPIVGAFMGGSEMNRKSLIVRIGSAGTVTKFSEASGGQETSVIN